ncbi:two-component system, cell cycle response regulator, partial [Candidatus Hakubella thermalkaliphila]
RKR